MIRFLIILLMFQPVTWFPSRIKYDWNHFCTTAAMRRKFLSFISSVSAPRLHYCHHIAFSVRVRNRIGCRQIHWSSADAVTFLFFSFVGLFLSLSECVANLYRFYTTRTMWTYCVVWCKQLLCNLPCWLYVFSLTIWIWSRPFKFQLCSTQKQGLGPPATLWAQFPPESRCFDPAAFFFLFIIWPSYYETSLLA